MTIMYLFNYSIGLFFLCLLIKCTAFNQWKYKVRWSQVVSDLDKDIYSSGEQASVKAKAWEGTWGKNGPKGGSNNPNDGYEYDGQSIPIPSLMAPRPRRGHSLVRVKVLEDTPKLLKGTYVMLFGGRDNDNSFTHIPRRYQILEKNGTISFGTYTDMPVNPCNDIDNIYYSKEQTASCSANRAQYSQINVGVIYNDMWAYRLCPVSNQHCKDTVDQSGQPKLCSDRRHFDSSCESSGWINLDPGAPEGGCNIQLGILVCTHPSERYEHAAAMFDDGLLYVYGGISLRCGDSCDDLWTFDIFLQSWKVVYPAGVSGVLFSPGWLSQLYNETNGIDVYNYSPQDVPVDDSLRKNAGPGNRWRHTMVVSKAYVNGTIIFGGKPINNTLQRFALFGGHRLWQGLAIENSEANSWENYDTLPPGGYLDDLWIYTKNLDFETNPGQTYKTSTGRWKKIAAKERCTPTPGLTWNLQDIITCETLWPQHRGGHGSAWDDTRNRIWIFGGYNTYYPYLSTDGMGSGPGVSSLNSGGFVPYPGYDYYLNDLWYYNLNDGYWYQIEYDPNLPVPDPRCNFVFLIVGEVLYMHGGYADNFFYDDLWYFNITTGRWLEKTQHVYPIYPKSCTDDEAYIAMSNKPGVENPCMELVWPNHVERTKYPPFKIKDYRDQPFYWPNPSQGVQFNILPRDFYINSTHNQFFNPDGTPNEAAPRYSDQASWGTPIPNFAKTAPGQRVRSFNWKFNETHSATLYEYCVSVYAEPTRGKLVDGTYGRSNGSIFLPQPRRQAPGWDGCRDRYDGRTNLPAGIAYVKPTGRALHRAVLIEDTNEIFFYGGMKYLVEETKSINSSYETVVSDEMWYFNLFHCIKNCSNNGDCYYGYCFCYVGYYGEDCSNSSCPGTSCYYDKYTFAQTCTHGCHSGYQHRDTDVYVQDIAKLPCSLPDVVGYSNGICDGFGSTFCAPPFVGDDCSIKDCKNNCSFNGWCSIEYPVSRCMCQPGYFGEICDRMVCLNNCSYPNGVCNSTTGDCNCRPTYNPFNNTQIYRAWEGEDCSYMWAYSAAQPQQQFMNNFYNSIMITFFVVVIIISVSIEGNENEKIMKMKN